jgi:hypothetical protein
MRLLTKITLAAWLLIGIFAFSVRGQAADQIGYAITSQVDVGDLLYRVNLTTATATLIGRTGTIDLEGLGDAPNRGIPTSVNPAPQAAHRGLVGHRSHVRL